VFGCLCDCNHLGVGCRVIQRFTLVMGGGDHSPFMHDDGTDRYLTLIESRAGFSQSDPHPAIVW
jgi:hypothetical protein